MNEPRLPVPLDDVELPAPYDGSLAARGRGGYPPSLEPDEERIDFRRVIAILRRNFWIIAACVGICGAAGWFITTRATRLYESRASLRIADTEPAVAGMELLQRLGGEGSEVNTELEVLRSRTLAGQVVDEFALRAELTTPSRVPRSLLIESITLDSTAPSGKHIFVRTDAGFERFDADGKPASARGLQVRFRPAARQHERIVIEVQSHQAAISKLVDASDIARPTRDANILTVAYRGPDPVLVEAIPNGLVRAFVEQRVGTRKTGARSTVGFLRSQLDTLQIELASAEDSLRAFREQEQVVAIHEQASVSVGKLAELQAERNQVSAELAAIEATLKEARARDSDVSGTSPTRRLLAFPTLLRNPVISTLLENITTLENERSTLLVRRTDRDPDIIALTGQIDATEEQIAALVGTYSDGLRQQVVAYDRSLEQSSAQLSKIPAKEVRLATLQRDATVLGELSTLLQTRLKEAEISAAVEDPSAQVIDFAVQPTNPVSPRPALNLALAMLLGMTLGLGISFGRELLDTKIHTADEVQEATGLPVLGIVPRFEPSLGKVRRSPRALRKGGPPVGTSLVAREDPHSNVLEAYRALRTNLAFSAAAGPPKFVLITSSIPGEGKSTTTANLAASLAQQGMRVAVVDADMRRGAVHRTLGGMRSPGLSEVLIGSLRIEAVIQKLTFDGIGGIDLISTGTVPPNPAELLGGPRFHDMLEVLEVAYDVVLIDSPPVNNVADALVIAPHVDAVMLVVRGGATDRAAMRVALDQLRQVRAKVIGTVLNDYDVKRAQASGGAYRYYYGSGYDADT
jgi:tyrosine-protein kinase Etk/Wzc